MGLGLIASALRKDLCVRFSSTGYCTFGTGVSAFDFGAGTAFTLYAWARWSNSGPQHILGRIGGGGSNTGWSLYTQNTSLRFSHKGGAPGTRLVVETTASGFDDGKWHAIVVTYAGTSAPSGCHIYIDGTDQPLTTIENDLTTATTGSFDMSAARDTNQSAFEFVGDIGSLAVFSGVLGSTDRATLLNTRHPPIKSAVLAISGILGFWRMGNGATAPTIPDETGANPGTLTSTTAALQTYAPPYS